MDTTEIKSVDDYFETAPEKSLEHLNTMRSILKETLPEAEEVISYNMPAFKQKKVVVYYAYNDKHLGYYPAPSGIAHFENQFKGKYKYSKGAVQVPYDQELPIDLIKEIALFRLNEVLK